MHVDLTSDAEAMLLLCSHLAMPRQSMGATTSPFTPREWNTLARSIQASPLQRPGALLDVDPATRQQALGLSDPDVERLNALLSRGGQLAIELEHLAQQGIWALTRVDVDYPVSLKEHLGAAAPLVLFGAGDKTTLSRGFLSVVGSRDVDERGTHFARGIGAKCAQEQLTIVSGMSRGADYESTFGALEAGGSAIGVLAGGLEKALRVRDVRVHVTEGRLTLVTAMHPRTSFSVGTAMARNKYIYCLAEYGLVVASSLEKGGTRAGALELLKARWVPLFVRSGADIPPGNRLLLQQGAIPFDQILLERDVVLSTWLQEAAIGWLMADSIPEVKELPDGSSAQLCPEGVDAQRRRSVGRKLDLFPIIWPTLRNTLDTPRTAQQVADTLSLEPVQAKIWLDRAVRDELAVLEKDEQYRIPTSNSPAVEQLRIPLE